jgi:hypothetical protein
MMSLMQRTAPTFAARSTGACAPPPGKLTAAERRYSIVNGTARVAVAFALRSVTVTRSS